MVKLTSMKQQNPSYAVGYYVQQKVNINQHGLKD
jgi:hypothetical protein